MHGDLRHDVGRGAEAVDAEAGRVAGKAQASIADEARAQERRSLQVRVSIRKREACALVRHHVVGVSAIERVTREQGAIAKVLATLAAVATLAARPAEPRHAHARADAKTLDGAAGRHHPADHLVARYERQPGLWELA